MNLALRLKLFRAAADLKQRDVADSLGVSVNYVSMLERGKREPTLQYLRAFSKVVRIPLHVILWEPPATGTTAKEKKLHGEIAALIIQFAKTQGLTV